MNGKAPSPVRTPHAPPAAPVRRRWWTLPRAALAAALAAGAVVGLVQAVPTISGTKSAGIQTDMTVSGQADPGDTLRYSVNVNNTAAPAAGNDGTGVSFTDTLNANLTLVPGSVHASPLAINDAYTTVANTALYVGVSPPAGQPGATSATSPFANDIQPNATAPAAGTDTFQFVSALATSANGGTVTFTASGSTFTSFVYVPPVGFVGIDTFTYTLRNSAVAALTDTGTITILVGTDGSNNGVKVWYVDASAPGGGDGRSTSPFNALAGAITASAVNEIIYVNTGGGDTTAGGTLKSGQSLIGRGVALIVDPDGIGAGTGITLLAAGTAPSLVTTTGLTNAITLSTTGVNTIRGVNFGNTTGYALFAGSFGTLNVDTVAINNAGNNRTGRLLNLTSGTANATFSNLSTTSSSGGNAILLDNVLGTFTGQAGAISGVAPGSPVMVITGGNGSVTLNNSVTLAAGASNSAVVTSKTGGTVAFGGDISDSGAGIAVNNNTGTTTNFTGKLTLNTAGGTAFTALNGGTVTATHADSTITTTTGSGVFVLNTSIGAAGLKFKSVTVGTAAGGPNNAILLTNTGTTGAFTITGDGGTALGGNGTGGTIQGTAGDAVALSGIQNTTIQNVTISNPAGHGIGGTNVGGTVLIRSVSISGVAVVNKDGIGVTNTGTNFTSFTADKVSMTGVATADTGFSFVAQGATTGSVTVSACSFTQMRGDGAQIINDGSGTLTSVIKSSSFTNAAVTNGLGGVFIAQGGTGVHNFTVGGSAATDANTFTDLGRAAANSGVIQVQSAGGGAVGAKLNGTIQRNTITTSTGRSGIQVQLEASVNQGNHSITIDTNTVNDVVKEGILVLVTSVAGADSTGNNVKVTNNQVGTTTPVGSSGRSGLDIETVHDTSGGGILAFNLLVQGNAVVTNGTTRETFFLGNDAQTFGGPAMSTINASIWGNTFTNQNAGGVSFRVRQFDSGSLTGLDLNGANVAANRNTSNLGFVVRRDAGTFNIATNGTAVANTDAAVGTFLTARNNNTVTATGANTWGFVNSVPLPP